jgi:ABC-type transport system involved in multi-copper enzyme maturation permease subunit
MKVLAANIEDVFREAAARWTLIAYFCLSTIFIVLFAAAVNLDVVNGALAGAKLFGKEMEVSGTLSIEKIVTGFESVFAVIVYILSLFLAIFATAHLVPRMQDKGTIDLYLSRPVSRLKLLFSRYLAGLLLAASNVAYLMTAIWAIVAWKTHVMHARFFVGGALILFIVAALLAFAFLIGVITSSTGVSIMTTYGLFLLSAIMFVHERAEAAVSSTVTAWLIRMLYYAMPKTVEIGMAVFAYVMGQGAPEFAQQTAVSSVAYVTTALFGIVCFALAALVFKRKEF